MATGVTLTVPAFVKDPEKFHQRLIEKLHEKSGELGQIEQANVSSRTQVLSRALISGISYEEHLNPDDNVLAVIYADEGPQKDEYGRVYDLYQEGGSNGFGVAHMGLGLGTNNGSGNHEMFGRMFTDDIAAIEAWGMECINEVLLEEALEELEEGDDE